MDWNQREEPMTSAAQTSAAQTSPASDLSAWSGVNVNNRECANAKIGWRPVVLLSVGVHGWDMRATFPDCLDWTWRGTGGKPAAEAAFGAFWAAHKGTLEAIAATKKRLDDAEAAVVRTRSMKGRAAAVALADEVRELMRQHTATVRAWKP